MFQFWSFYHHVGNDMADLVFHTFVELYEMIRPKHKSEIFSELNRHFLAQKVLKVDFQPHFLENLCNLAGFQVVAKCHVFLISKKTVRKISWELDRIFEAGAQIVLTKVYRKKLSQKSFFFVFKLVLQLFYVSQSGILTSIQRRSNVALYVQWQTTFHFWNLTVGNARQIYFAPPFRLISGATNFIKRSPVPTMLKLSLRAPFIFSVSSELCKPSTKHFVPLSFKYFCRLYDIGRIYFGKHQKLSAHSKFCWF